MTKNVLFVCSVFLLIGSYSLLAHQESDVCPSSTNLQHVLVSQKYPGAQKWFNYMAQKYPQAKLARVLFYVGDNYESEPGSIYFPDSCLAQMNQVFASGACSELSLDQFKQEEYLLLHEAAHVNNWDSEKGVVAALTVVFGVLILNAKVLSKVAAKKSVGLKDILTSTLGTAGLTCLWYAYAQHQEKNADNFANQQADKKSLQAGATFFARVKTLMSFENINVPDWLNNAFQCFQDPAHPLPQNRYNAVQKALQNRFG
jgi:hypothetical protein